MDFIQNETAHYGMYFAQKYEKILILNKLWLLWGKQDIFTSPRTESII